MNDYKKIINWGLRGFTLIELLIVISVIAILAAVVFVALDPLTRFQDARDATRVTDITALLSAIKVDQVDNGGSYIAAVSGLSAGEVYMIGTGSSSCDDDACGATVTDDDNCRDLTPLVTEGYIGEIPVSPAGATTWSAATTGYTISRASTGILTLQACEAEGGGDITVAR